MRVKFAEQFGSSFWPPIGPITVHPKLYLTATGSSSPPALYSRGRNKFGFSLRQMTNITSSTSNSCNSISHKWGHLVRSPFLAIQSLESGICFTVLTFDNSTDTVSSIDVTAISSSWLSTLVDPVIPDNVKFSLGPLTPSFFCKCSWKRVTSDPLSNKAYVSTGGRSIPLTWTVRGPTLKHTRSPAPVAAVTLTLSWLLVSEFEPSIVFNLRPSRLSWLWLVPP